MENVTRIDAINPTDTQITFPDGKVVVLRTDAPTIILTQDELAVAVQSATNLHKSFMESLNKIIDNDSYIQIGANDNLIIANETERLSIVYPNGSFAKYSPLFYLDWLPEGMLVEVTEDENKLAKFVYKK